MLGYVIYNDGKKWRKEQSWNTWKAIYESPEDFERKKIESYNNAINAYWSRVKDGKLTDVWINNNRVTMDVSSKDDIIKVYPYEDHRFYSRNTSTNEKIKPIEFENEALEGFVLNKKAGGGRYGWNPRQTYCRVYDPRGFEFEITIPNLLYILENTNSIKGKGLEGKLIYGWQGKDLVLVPENAPEFEAMMNYTKIQDGKVWKKDMKLGGIYCNKDNERLVYMGDFFEIGWRGAPSTKKKLWFSCDGKHGHSFIHYAAAVSLKVDTGETAPDFADRMDKLEKETACYTATNGIPEYERVENPEKELEERTTKNNGYSSPAALFIKKGTKFIKFDIYRRNAGGGWGYNRRSEPDNWVYQVSYEGRDTGREFKTIKNITDTFELWQLKTTK